MNGLDDLALKYGTDKASNHHNYTETYARITDGIRDVVKSVVEIGVGGETYRGNKGASLRMWREWFPGARIVGLDNDPTVKGDYGPRIDVVIGDQTSRTALDDVIERVDRCADLIIDDGSHNIRLTIATFEYLWPHLAPGGLYVIEDTQCTYTQLSFNNDRSEFDRFLLFLIHSVDINGRKVTPRDAADMRLADDSVFNIYESSLQSIEVVRGLLILRKRDPLLG